MDLGDAIIAPRSVSMVGRNINCKCANGLSGRHNYGLDRPHLGAPNLPLRPRKGQAVVFRAWDHHAVEPLSGEGDRITNAAFFGISDMTVPAAVFA